MSENFQKRLIILWLTLLALTLLGSIIGGLQIVENQLSDRAVHIVLAVIAAVKVRLVISYFMEVRESPLALRLLFDGWLIAVLVIITSLL